MDYEFIKNSISTKVATKFSRLQVPEVIVDEVINHISALIITQHLKNEGRFLINNNHIPDDIISFNRSIKLFAKATFITLFALLKIFLSQTKLYEKTNVALVYSLPFNHIPKNNDIDQISKFIDDSLLKVQINLPSKYLIQTNKLINREETSREKFVPHLGTELLLQVNIKKFKKAQVIVSKYIEWIRLILRDNLFLFVGPEFIIDHFVYSNISKTQYKILITTQSQIFKTPISFKLLKDATKIMFWYSNNSKPIQLKRDKSEFTSNLNYLNNGEIDLHFVWTSSWAAELANIVKKPVIAIGPIIFKKLNLNQEEPKLMNSQKILTIFDVTPKNNCSSESFYSFKNMVNFTNSVISAANEVNLGLILQLKNKREFKKDDSLNYKKFLKTIENKIVQISPNLDIDQLIMDSDLVVCTPYTSPAVIAQHFGKPVVYFWPDNNYSLLNEMDDIKVIIGIEELKAFIIKVLGYP
jgi:polysaccharide biosynthesis PFTS motif protein